MKRLIVFIVLFCVGSVGGWVIMCAFFNATIYARSGEAIPFSIIFFLRSENVSEERLLLMALMVGLFLSIKYLMSDTKKIKNIKGSSRWAKYSEIKKGLTAIKENSVESAKQTGAILARRGSTIYVDTTTTHTLGVGSTRSGKTQIYILPMIKLMLSGKDKPSIVVNDPKGEILEYMYQIAVDNGYNVKVLNLRNTNKSDNWNPLQFIIDIYRRARRTDGDMSLLNDFIDTMCETLTRNDKSDPIWPSSAKSLLTALILYLLETGYDNNSLDKVNMASVYQFFIEYGEDEVVVKNGAAVSTNKLDTIFKNLPAGSPAKAAYATSRFAQGEMRSSIFATLADNIKLFGRDEGIMNMTSGSDINFDELDNEQPCIIFMIIPDDRPNRHVIASMFVNQCYSSLVDHLSQIRKDKLQRRVHFVLDEFANMVTIPEMSGKLTVSAGRNILFHLFIQDLAMLEAKYNKDAKTIRSNCGNQVYIYAIDYDTNAYYSKLFGMKTQEYKTYSGKAMDSASQHIDSKELSSADELSLTPIGEIIVKRQRMYPIKSKMKLFYKSNPSKIPIDDIPIAQNRRKYTDWVFPFKFIDKKIEQQQQDGNGAPSAEQLGKAFRPAPPAPPQQDEQRKSPIIMAIQSANEISDGEFANCLSEGEYDECLTLLRRYKISRSLPDETISILMDYINSIGNI